NNIKTKDGILEWIAPQETPFSQVDNKYYFVVWRGEKTDDWRIIKFKHSDLQEKILDSYNRFCSIPHTFWRLQENKKK
ncbi:hypothetical protein, partial [Spiroplasma phoeniceum]|uniref:hypothetical protein n=1 Tax=Spiroplasma phoeniceum TaxID=47835 RepID=UPI0033650BE1